MNIHRKLTLALAMILILLALPIVTSASEDDSKEAKITRAMEAAPDFITKNATIVEADGTVLRQGTNGWSCIPEMPGGAHPMCNDEVWMRLLTAVGNKADFKTDTVGISYMLAGDDNVNNADPYDQQVDPEEVWVQEGPHLMIVVPNTGALDGLSDNPDIGGPYVMWKGTPYVHIMVPVGPR